MESIKTFCLNDYSAENVTRGMREYCMSCLDGMKDACWENVHGGVSWEPIAEGFLKGIVPCMDAHDAIVRQKAEQEDGERRARTLEELGGMETVREYMNSILHELKQATREHGRPALKVIK